LQKKYYIKREGDPGPVAALRYDLRKERLLIGGKKRIEGDLAEISECFGVIFDFTVWKTYGRTGKMRTEVALSPMLWTKGLERLGSKGYILERVTGFRRFMR